MTARYRSFEGEESERDVSPHGLVVHSGRWYLTAYDHGRDALRTFRVDRMSRVAVPAGAARPAPDGFDAVAYVSRSLARVPWPYEVEVLLRLPLADATSRLPATLAEFAEEDGGTRVRMRTSSLDWTAGLLAGLGCEFTIRRPDELRESVRALADRLTACVTPSMHGSMPAPGEELCDGSAGREGAPFYLSGVARCQTATGRFRLSVSRAGAICCAALALSARRAQTRWR